jgi:HrpA-like RNA helicase
MDPPTPEILIRALESLNYLEALDNKRKLTNVRYYISKLPIDLQLLIL